MGRSERRGVCLQRDCCMTAITADEARALLRYEPETGLLYWRERPNSAFSHPKTAILWKASRAGKEAFTAYHKSGYRRGRIYDREYLAHRIIWLLQTGNFPKFEIDHINGVRHDNRWGNLRDVTRVENCRNLCRRSDNTTGVTGVCWYPPLQKWQAQITISGHRKHLGYFDSLQEASAARSEASIALGFSARHGEEVAA